jgi:CO/xanthine dehydrogenase Mo-binding subunit
MTKPFVPPLSRRALLAGGGAVIVSFALTRHGLAQEAPAGPKLPGDLSKTPMLDAWIGIDAQGKITVFTGKAELGQGVKTAFIQCAAEELAVQPSAINLITADTGRTPDEGYTAGSHSMQDSGTAIRNAAAQVRDIMLSLAAAKLSVDAGTLDARDGKVSAKDGRSLGYGALASGQALHVAAQPTSRLTPPDKLKVIGSNLPRVDIPGKVTGAPMYVQDMRRDGMLHARVLRPANYGARLASLSADAARGMPGVVNIVQDGSFVAVVARGEFEAINALNVLSQNAQWSDGPQLPEQAKIYSTLTALPSQDKTILDKGDPAQPGVKRLKATYLRPYQSHGSIGPSCALAIWQDDMMTVWTHSQGVYPLRNAIAKMPSLPSDKVRCIHAEGSGCYGHNAADDVAGDAALIARAMPGTPIRVQWMREDEHGWEPFGPAMQTQVEASIDGQGKLLAWQYDVWSNTHSMRPGGPGNLLAAQYLAQPFQPDPPMPIPQPEGGGDRNAIPLYAIPNARVVSRFIPQMPIRVSALRGLGAYHNIFTTESFMDEMADAAGADPVAFRLAHLEDERARAVVSRAADAFGWTKDKPAAGWGRGFAFARYKNLAAYCAIALELRADRTTGNIELGRVVAAVDSGQAVNPDGIRNQIEGAIVQSSSWTILEEVTFDRTSITSRDWSSYPILRFPSLPQSVEVHIVNRPNAPFLGTGEAAQGPMSAAIGNAFARATGTRIRQLPLSPQRVRATLAT